MLIGEIISPLVAGLLVELLKALAVMKSKIVKKKGGDTVVELLLYLSTVASFRLECIRNRAIYVLNAIYLITFFSFGGFSLD